VDVEARVCKGRICTGHYTSTSQTIAEDCGRCVRVRVLAMCHSRLEDVDQQESEKLSDQELLKYYSEKWKDYTDGAQYVNKLFNYLNKHWVKREKDEGRKEVYTVYTVSPARRL
jgi:cullin 1